jgi:hypothetical protein
MGIDDGSGALVPQRNRGELGAVAEEFEPGDAGAVVDRGRADAGLGLVGKQLPQVKGPVFAGAQLQGSLPAVVGGQKEGFGGGGEVVQDDPRKPLVGRSDVGEKETVAIGLLQRRGRGPIAAGLVELGVAGQAFAVGQEDGIGDVFGLVDLPA